MGSAAMDLNGKSILVTGGTGSFGRAFVQRVLTRFPQVARLVVYSRDELKQYEMQQLPELQHPAMRYFLGDVRDLDRLRRGLEGIDVVVHAAALKQVPAAEYNPFEVIKTNVLGGQNVIEACLDQDVSHVVALSTDKAAAAINLYGATKLCSDKLFVAANHFKGARRTRFSVLRYGNVMGSRGSVIPLFLKKRQTRVLPITDLRMTRFNITLDFSVEKLLFALDAMWGGEIFVPKIPSYRITDLAEAVCPGAKHEIVGIRPGEKLHEMLITSSDGLHTLEFERHYVILPSLPLWDVAAYLAEKQGKRCASDFRYQSGDNDLLDVPTLRRLIKEHVDPSFEPAA